MSAAAANAARPGPAFEGCLGLRVAPRLMGDAAQRETRLLDRSAFEVEADRNRHQREGIGQTIADLQVGVVGRKSARRQLDRRDELVGPSVGVAPQACRRKPVKIRQGDDALAARARHMHLGLEHGQRHAHVGGMHSDAVSLVPRMAFMRLRPSIADRSPSPACAGCKASRVIVVK